MPDEPNPASEAAATPVTNVDAEPEQIKEVFHEILGFKNRFKKLRSFFRTRKQIKSGAYLFDNSADELKSKGLMGPLTFNIYSSTLAGTLALALSKSAGFVFPSPSDSSTQLRPLDAVTEQYLKLIPAIDSYLRPFLVPMVFLLIAYCLSWGTIRRSRPTVSSISGGSVNSRPSRVRGRNAFLYFDGAYGFIPQFILATIFVMFKLLIDNVKWYQGSVTTPPVVQNGPPQISPEFTINPVYVALAFVIFAILVVTILYIGYLTYYKFPKLLFTAHGYYRQNKEVEEKNASPKPPWGKYILTALIIGPVVATLSSYGFAGIVIVLARFLAVVFTMANGKFWA